MKCQKREVINLNKMKSNNNALNIHVRNVLFLTIPIKDYKDLFNDNKTDMFIVIYINGYSTLRC